MGKKVKLKKRKKLEKERPFDDSDTVIQWREDFVQDYIKEPLMRKAVETPVVERVVTEDMERDMIVQDEEDDIGVRTRQKQLPAMPLDAEFMSSMQNSVESTILKDVQNNLRFYNDAIRNPATTELGKVFLLGVVRQLRYWSMTQTPQPEIAEGNTAIDWVLGNLLDRIDQDMSLLSKHFSPEIDKVYFRRWKLELQILKKELIHRKEQSDLARKELEEQGFDPLNSDTPQKIPLPETNIIQWVKENPDLVDLVLNDPTQADNLLQLAWSEIFNNDSSIEYLNLLDTFGLRAQMDFQTQEAFQSLITKMKKGSANEIHSLLQDSDFSGLTPEIKRAFDVLKETSFLPIIQKLLKLYGGGGAELVTATQEDTSMFSQILRSYGTNE